MKTAPKTFGKSLMSLSLVFAGFAAVAGTCTWVGGSGYKWSTAANWQEGVVPTTGDDVVLSSVSGGAADTHEIVNDIPGLTLASLTFGGTTAVTFEGEPLTIKARTSSSQYAVTSCVAAVSYVDMTFVANGSAKTCRTSFGGNFSQYGDWNIEDGATLGVRRTNKATVDVYGAIKGPNATYQFLSGCALTWLGSVDLKAITPYGSDSVPFNLKTHDFKLAEPLQPGTYSTISGLTPEAWQGLQLGLSDADYGDHGANRRIFSMSVDQTISRLFGGRCFVKSDGTDGDADEASVVNGDSLNLRTLTIKATQSDVTYAGFRGKLNVIWAPTDDYTLELRRRTLKTTGTFFVKGGTLRAASNTVFSAAAAVKVGNGAALDVATDNAFGASVPLWVADGGRVVLTNGNNLTVAKAYYKGLPLAAGTYDKNNAAWIVGDGTVTVSGTDTAGNFWKEAVNGSWSDATKWSKGTVPTSASTAYVTAEGTNYTVTVDSAVTAPGVFNLSSVSTNTVCVNVTEGGNWAVNGTPKVEIGRNGEWRVSGGTVALTNTATSTSGYFNISGDEGATGRVHVVSGTFRFCAKDFNLATIYGGGAFEAEGGICDFKPLSISQGNNLLYNQGGRIEITGDAQLIVSSYCNFGYGEAIIAGSAKYGKTGDNGYNVGVSPSANLTGYATVKDDAMIGLQSINTFYVGCNVDAYGFMRFDSSAAHPTDATKTFTIDMRVAANSGKGRLEVAKGSITIGDQGLKIGSVDGLSSASTGAHGEVDVSGGFLDVWCSNLYDGNYGKLLGINVGNASYWSPTQWAKGVQIGRGHPFVGKMTVSGGRIELINGEVTIGSGTGRGTWEQTGGVMTNKASVVSVGLAGGIGRLSLSGGEFVSKGDIYVGGAPTNAFTATGQNKKTVGEQLVTDGNYPIDRHDADGVFTLSGGLLDASKVGFHLGEDGTGTLNVNGAAGTFKAKSLVTAGSSAKIAFAAAADGVTPLEVQTATLRDGTRIDVDLTAMPEEGRRLCLVRSTGITADLSKLSVSFRDGSAGRDTKAGLRLRSSGLYAVVPGGSVIILR